MKGLEAARALRRQFSKTKIQVAADLFLQGPSKIISLEAARALRRQFSKKEIATAADFLFKTHEKAEVAMAHANY